MSGGRRRLERFDAERIAESLADLGRAEVTASPVSGSSYRHVEVYLTDAGADGPYVALSEQAEYEEGDGVLVGGYAHYETDGDVEVYATVAEALDAARERARELVA